MAGYYISYSIWFLGQDINWDIVLSPAPAVLFIYFILLFFCLSNIYIFMYLLILLITSNKSSKVSTGSA